MAGPGPYTVPRLARVVIANLIATLVAVAARLCSPPSRRIIEGGSTPVAPGGTAAGTTGCDEQ